MLVCKCLGNSSEASFKLFIVWLEGSGLVFDGGIGMLAKPPDKDHEILSWGSRVQRGLAESHSFPSAELKLKHSGLFD